MEKYLIKHKDSGLYLNYVRKGVANLTEDTCICYQADTLREAELKMLEIINEDRFKIVEYRYY